MKVDLGSQKAFELEYDHSIRTHGNFSATIWPQEAYLIWQPENILSENPEKGGVGVDYPQFLFYSRDVVSENPLNFVLNPTIRDTMKAQPVACKATFRRQKTTKGFWSFLKFKVVIPLKGPRKFYFPSQSYVGFLFGNLLAHVLFSSSLYLRPEDDYLQPLNPEQDLTSLREFFTQAFIDEFIARWVDARPRPGVPEFYEISQLSARLVDSDPTKTKTFSKSRLARMDAIGDIESHYPLRQGLVELATLVPGLEDLNASYFYAHTQEFRDMLSADPNTMLFIRCHKAGLLFASLFYKIDVQVQEKPGGFSESDSVWLLDSLEPDFESSESMILTLNTSFFTKNIPTGCRTHNRLGRIFSKSSKSREILVFSPLGLPAKNCVLECVEFYLRNLEQKFSEDFLPENFVSANEFLAKPEISAMLFDAINIIDPKTQKVISNAAKINIVCFYEHIDESNTHTIRDAHWPACDAATHLAGEEPLRILCHNEGSDAFGYPMWHASVVKGFGSLKNKKLCKHCKDWFSENSPHFSNCSYCDKCGKHFNSKGNHYISCAGKMIQSKKTREDGLLSPSAISHELWQLWKNVWFADFECFQNKSGTHIPYLVVLKEISSGSNSKKGKSGSQNFSFTFWGKNCLKDFITFIMDAKNRVTGYLYCHNGSGYDFNLILAGLLQFTDKATGKGLNVLMRGNKILTCQISRKPWLALRDSYLLIPAGLSKICKDLKLDADLSKTSFDHSKIFSFASAEIHKVEAVKYCTQDVEVLERIFKLFSRAMWDIAPVLLQTSMSLASHALEMWKILEKGPILNSLTLPDLSTYAILREMYHGGRVLATVPKYDSGLFDFITEEDADGNFTFFDEDGNTLMDFSEIKENFENFKKELGLKEALKQVDVVSLYPHVMYEKEFPTGVFIPKKVLSEQNGIEEAEQISSTIKSGKWAILDFDDQIIRAENPGYGSLKAEMFRHCYQVQMECPQDAIVAFLMRKEEGSPVQNLLPLDNYWVTGVELFEAIKIGYTLKKVYAKFGWASLHHVFKKYIGVLFKIKEENKADKSSVMYQVAKLLMNALSGKFGQKIVSRVTTLLSEMPDDPDTQFENLVNIETQIIEALDENDKKQEIGYLFTGDKTEDKMDTSLPTQLSVFILAHSRRKMSKMLRFTGGYFDPKKTLMYTDTDSMVVTESTYKDLVKGRFIGGKLGQLEDEFPKELIVSARFLAPKVYCLMMLKQVPNSSKAAIAYKIRCKGIPHRGDVFFANSYKLDEREFKIQVDEIDEATSTSVKDLSRRFYVIKEKEKDTTVMIHPFINISICDLILSEKFYMQVHFGSILKNSKVKFSLQSKWVSRSLGFNSWWNNPKCPRIMKDTEGYEITACKGTQQE